MPTYGRAVSLAYRPALERDLKFCLYSWVKSQKFEPTAGLIAVEDWREVMTPQLARILSRPGAEIFVAYETEATDYTADLYGWIAVERGHKARFPRGFPGRKTPRLWPLVHYIFVKKLSRYEGIGRGLFKAARVDPESWFFHSCQTGMLSVPDANDRTPLLNRFPRAQFRPVLARHPRDQNRKAPRDHGQNSKEANVPQR